MVIWQYQYAGDDADALGRTGNTSREDQVGGVRDVVDEVVLREHDRIEAQLLRLDGDLQALVDDLAVRTCHVREEEGESCTELHRHWELLVCLRCAASVATPWLSPKRAGAPVRARRNAA